MRPPADDAEAALRREDGQRRRPHSFGRALFQILVLGILVPAGMIWAVGHVTARAAVTYLWDGLSREIAEHSVERTLRYLETGTTALDYNDAAVRLGLVDPHDRRAMLAFLLAGLEANPNVTWYTFAGADGAYLSAYHHPEGGLRLTWREQEEGGARYRDFRIEGDGTWTPLEEVVKPYDPRTRRWFEDALAAGGEPVWSEPFLFASGPPGFILSRSVHGADGAALGVWAAEYEMSYVSEFLAALRIGTRGRAYLVTAGGRVIGHPLFDKRLKGAAEGWIVVERDGERQVADATTHRDPWLKHAYEEARRGHGEEISASFEVDGDTYLCAATPFPPAHGLDWTVLIVVPEADILGSVHRNSLLAGVAAVLIAAFFLLLGNLTARRRLSRPLADVAHDLEVMARLETEAEPRVVESGISEVQGMVRAREVMRGGLRSFKKYVPADLVRELMESGQEAILGGEKRELTVLFSDIAGFTRISEEIGDPGRLVDALSEYLGAMSQVIADHGGTVDKYVGDAIIAFWGAPKPHPTHALSACKAAWESQVALRRLRETWRAEGKPAFEARIGVNTGEVLVGNIGSAARMNYTVMGDAVNLCSRIDGVCSLYGLDIAVGDATWQVAREHFEGRPVDCVAVKGREQAVVFYELIGPKGEVEADRIRFAALYAEAFGHYMAAGFPEARKGFERALALAPDDKPTRELLARCVEFEREPPGPGWNGAVRLTRKKK